MFNQVNNLQPRPVLEEVSVQAAACVGDFEADEPAVFSPTRSAVQMAVERGSGVVRAFLASAGRCLN